VMCTCRAGQTETESNCPAESGLVRDKAAIRLRLGLCVYCMCRICWVGGLKFVEGLGFLLSVF
jgi:hypothetical protein